MKKVSGYTHTKKQMDDYANQHNPNNRAHQACKSNHAKQLLDPHNACEKMSKREMRIFLSQITYDAFENDD